MLFLAWFTTIAVDFFFYGGVFAFLFERDDPYLLTSDQLFARIPAGYASFAVEVVALGWLLSRLQTGNWRDGAGIGAVAGAVVGGALLAGFWSVAATSGALLVSWWVVLTVQMASAGAVLGAGVRVPLRRLAKRVLVAALLLVVATVILQNVAITSR
ncbi:MAG: hypothetical protein V3S32_06880 [Acidimicrobiia bacterium]